MLFLGTSENSVTEKKAKTQDREDKDKNIPKEWKKTKNGKRENAPAGNRTRVCTVAGYYSTTRPLVPFDELSLERPLLIAISGTASLIISSKQSYSDTVPCSSAEEQGMQVSWRQK